MSRPGQAINLPPRVQSGQPITAAHFNAIRESIARLARSGIPDGPKIYPRLIKLPLDVYNLTKDGSTFTVSIREGYVIERTVINDTGTDCLTYHEPTGILSMGEPVEHTVADGQAIFVKVTVQDDGTISASEIVVDATDTESTHYAPPVGDETAGAVGEYFYKLAEFATDGSTLSITRFHAGANIEHFQELPRFKKAGGTADVFKTFDQEAGEFKTRGLTGIDGIEVTQGTDEITIGFDGAENLNLEVFGAEFSAGLLVVISSSPLYILYWRNGIFVGQSDPDGGSPPAGLITRQVTHCTT